MFDFFTKGPRARKTIHLDYASTTPVAPEVFRAMQPYFMSEWANPSAIYSSGVRTRTAVEDARLRIARILRIRPHGVLFTSGGTESNNHALFGIVESLHTFGRPYEDMEIVTTPMEHPSILETCDALRKKGVIIKNVHVTEEGRIDEKSLLSLMSTKTILLTFAYVNSEIGVIQDVKRITRSVRAFNTEHAANILIHLDASQAPLWLSCEMDRLGVDLMTLDAGKCYGPKGIGLLAMKHGVTLAPFMFGGGQEGGLRSGTENVPLIVGCAVALERAQTRYEVRSAKVSQLRDFMLEQLSKEIPETLLNGSKSERVANNLNISILGIDSEYAVVTLDSKGVAASTKSACGTNTSYGSYVVRAITHSEARAISTIRFTLGEATTKKDLMYTVHILRAHVIAMQRFIKTLKE